MKTRLNIEDLHKNGLCDILFDNVNQEQKTKNHKGSKGS
jgi:hypothetical protein